MSACRCGRKSSAKSGQCVICAGAIERRFCPDCFTDLHPNEAERTMDCWICRKSFYLADGQKIPVIAQTHKGTMEEADIEDENWIEETDEGRRGNSLKAALPSEEGQSPEEAAYTPESGPTFKDLEAASAEQPEAMAQTQKPREDMTMPVVKKAKRPYNRKPKPEAMRPEEKGEADKAVMGVAHNLVGLQGLRCTIDGDELMALLRGLVRRELKSVLKEMFQ